MRRALIVIPTYNEKDNIVEMIQTIKGVDVPGYLIEILVVDSNSPDGTGAILDDLRKTVSNLHVYHQPKKLGLGRAYLDGFKYIETDLKLGDTDAVITMDADFSHHPRYLPAMLAGLEHHQLVVGSRYVPGGRLENWPTNRKILSRFANFYAQVLTGVTFRDLTAGFHCFRYGALKRVLRYKGVIKADGYAFLIELKYFAVYEGFKVTEVPIVFSDRTKGQSKISERVILESALIPWKCLFTNLSHPRSK